MIQFASFAHKVKTYTPDEVIISLGKIMARAINEIADKLELPIEAWLSADGTQIDVRYPAPDEADIMDSKELFRAELMKRGYDIMLVRKIMKIVFGKPDSIEEV